MIKVSFDASKKLVTLEPIGECADEDFFTQSEVINQYVADGNELELLLRVPNLLSYLLKQNSLFTLIVNMIKQWNG